MKVRVTDVRVTDDLYLEMRVDADGKVGEYSYNIVWEDVSDIENIDHATERALSDWCGGLCMDVLAPFYLEAAQKMRDALADMKIADAGIELEV